MPFDVDQLSQKILLQIKEKWGVGETNNTFITLDDEEKPFSKAIAANLEHALCSEYPRSLVIVRVDAFSRIEITQRRK